MPQFDSSAFWGIAGIVVGVIGMIVSLNFGRKRALLKYKVLSTKLIANEISCIPGLDISLNGEVVPDLTMSKVKIYNLGNRTIFPSDFSSIFPLGLTTTGNIFYSRIDCDSVHKEYMVPSLSYVQGKAIVDFEFLEPKDSLTITVLHSGEISISGELITGLFQKYYARFERIAIKISKVLNREFLTSVIAGIVSSAVFAIICLIGQALLNIILGFFGVSK